MWYKGPEFLQADELSFPNEPIPVPEGDCSIETKTKYKDSDIDSENNLSFSLFRKAGTEEMLLKISNNYFKIVRVLAYVYRFIRNCRRVSVEREGGGLSIQEISRAEAGLIKLVQEVEFREEMKALRDGKSVPTSSRLRFFLPF